jgi:hypothetical protein
MAVAVVGEAKSGQRPMRRMIGNKLDRCSNYLSRTRGNGNTDHLTAAYISQGREELLQSDVFTSQKTDELADLDVVQTAAHASV